MTLSTTLAAPTPYPGLPRVTRGIPEQRVMTLPDVPVKRAFDTEGTMARAQGDDVADAVRAWAEIYEHYRNTVFRFIYFRTGNRPLSEDLTGDVFVRAMKRVGSFTFQGRDLGAWLITIARNLVADHFKSGRYRLEISTGEGNQFDGLVDDDPAIDPAAAAVNYLTSRQLMTAIKQLNPEQHAVIVHRFLLGHSVAETAIALGKNEGAIKACQYRAVRALARLLGDDGPVLADIGGA